VLNCFTQYVGACSQLRQSSTPAHGLLSGGTCFSLLMNVATKVQCNYLQQDGQAEYICVTCNATS